jgi:hypothetical protein
MFNGIKWVSYIYFSIFPHKFLFLPHLICSGSFSSVLGQPG